MGLMPPSNKTMEGTIAASFSKSLVVALADLMDDSGSHDRKADEKPKETTDCSQSENPQKAISKPSSSYYCSPYDYYSWMGGDCMRETAVTSLATITECATMKTDNTSEMIMATDAPTEFEPAIVSPCSSNNSADKSTKTSTYSSSHELDMDLNEDQNSINHNKKHNDSVSSSEMNNNANADIISQYHQQYISKEVQPIEHRSVSKTLFPEFIDYSDPMNSILVEDQTDVSKNARNFKSDEKDKDFKKGKDWLSVKSSSSPWCGGVSAMLLYNYYDDNQKQEQIKQEAETPDYCADFKPQRQYAFDEDDSDEYGENTSNIPALMDSDISTYYNSTDDGTAGNETNSVITNVSSVQSFMMINRPHTNSPISTIVSTGKPEHGSQRITPEHGHHLHDLIASNGPINMSSPGPSQITDTESDESSDNNRFDHALTPSLMRRLQKHLPYGKRGDSFWLQYSLIRDGASLDCLLDMVRKDAHSNNICSVLAIETVEGEVFGAFLTQTWKRSYNQWYGGGQSFLWSTSPGTSASTESNNNHKSGTPGSEKDKKCLRVFPYSFVNSYVQLCDRDRLLVGGGDGGDNYERHCYGFGLALERDLLRGSSCPCTTFESPSLSKLHSDGSSFEIRNLELWTLTPCLSMLDNPSQGLTRIHKRDDRSKPKKVQSTKKDQSTKATEDAAENTHALKDFYNCSQCHGDNTNDDVQLNGGNLAAGTFPGTQHTVTLNRNVRRHNRQRRKNRDEYVGLSVSM